MADLTPVDLQVFAWQALEANRHVDDGLLVQERPLRSDVIQTHTAGP